jgi:hypothetical protein
MRTNPDVQKAFPTTSTARVRMVAMATSSAVLDVNLDMKLRREFGLELPITLGITYLIRTGNNIGPSLPDLMSNHIATVTTLAHNYLSHNILVYEKRKGKGNENPPGNTPFTPFNRPVHQSSELWVFSTSSILSPVLKDRSPSV